MQAGFADMLPEDLVLYAIECVARDAPIPACVRDALDEDTLAAIEAPGEYFGKPNP